MKSIIIFTSRISIAKHLRHKISFELGKDTPVHKVPVSQDSVILLAFDDIQNADCIQQKLKGTTEVYVLYHSQTNEGLITEIASFAQQHGIRISKHKSQHDDKIAKLPNAVYYLLPKIDDSQNDPAALQEIFDELLGKLGGDKTLGNKFEFLHQCIFPKTIPESAPEWMKDNGVAMSKFETLKNLNAESPFDDTYLNTLRELRDALLGEH